MGDITALLLDARGGDSDKLGAVFEALYSELRRLASARAAGAGAGDAVTTTALVHETYLRLVRARDLDLRDRRHFFACAAQAMRHILVDEARAALAAKRGGGLAAVALPDELADPRRAPDWIDLDRALDELDSIHPDLRELVELRFYAGLSRAETAELLGCVERTVQRNWQRARAFLHARLEAGA